MAGQRIGVVTTGGDAPGLNAVIRAIVKAAYQSETEPEIRGYRDGMEGVMERRWLRLTPDSIKGILPRAGTMLGAGTRVNPFNVGGVDQSELAMQELRELDVLMILGGNGSMALGHALHTRYGLPVIGIPKTIDNDVVGTDMTFGFDSAVMAATEAIDRLHATAEAHHRVFVVETMGRDVGWIALYAGIGGGADVILMPEVPFSIDRVAETIRWRDASGRRFTIVVVAEGARPREGEPCYSMEGERRRYGGIATWLAGQLSARVDQDVRPIQLGHIQRGVEPTARDRRLATALGAHAVELARDGHAGCMVALRGNQITKVPLDEVQGVRRVTPDDPLYRTGISIGISYCGQPVEGR
ncbi:MAG TPA: ATP-dependent 6-phosphofructokinase [Thermomicrobiales bacterium]|nr:ATP-dependent 6-phosphofructokinase [Thermomicrobiales bacterium]